MDIKRKKVELGRDGRKIQRVRAGEQLPDLDSLLDPRRVEDPLGNVEYTGDVETDSAEEVSAALRAIKKEKRERRDQYRLLTDTEFWFAVCFQSREQKEEFLEKAGWAQAGLADKYIDGLALARLLNVDVQPIPLPTPSIKKAPKGLRTNNLIRR
jgi:hypothetical protein